MKNRNILIWTALFAVGLFLGYLLSPSSEKPQTMEEHIEETHAHTDEDGVRVYTCSMHPQVRESEPGNCPICGMELIPVEQGSSTIGEDNPNVLTMTQAAIKLAEIETSPVVKRQPLLEVRLSGKVVENRNLVSNVTAHFPGRIRELYVDYNGAYVTKGQKLASIYSPELVVAQLELLEAAKVKQQNPQLYEAAKRKLELWEFPAQTIEEIERSGEIKNELDYVSPVSGFVSNVTITREDHVNEGTVLYEIADLSSIWLNFEAYESDISIISTGDSIHFTVAALPGEIFRSEVTFVSPYLNDDSRSSTIRTVVKNSTGKLKPGMFAEALIESSGSGDEKLMVPRSAVMWTGKRSVVFVKLPHTEIPAFEAREVVLGERAGNYFIVESGLEEGEQVVTNGTFKIDSAAQLADKFSMMNREPGTGANRTGHEGHTMESSEEMDEREDHSNH